MPTPAGADPGRPLSIADSGASWVCVTETADCATPLYGPITITGAPDDISLPLVVFDQEVTLERMSGARQTITDRVDTATKFWLVNPRPGSIVFFRGDSPAKDPSRSTIFVPMVPDYLPAKNTPPTIPTTLPPDSPQPEATDTQQPCIYYYAIVAVLSIASLIIGGVVLSTIPTSKER